MKNRNHVDSFERSLEHANQWLNELRDRAGLADKGEAYAVLRAVLHALRDRLPVYGAADLAAQLPLLLKGVFFDGWTPAGKPVKMDDSEFLAAINRGIPGAPAEIEQPAACVFRMLAERLAPGTLDKIALLLPKRLQDRILFPLVGMESVTRATGL